MLSKSPAARPDPVLFFSEQFHAKHTNSNNAESFAVFIVRNFQGSYGNRNDCKKIIQTYAVAGGQLYRRMRQDRWVKPSVANYLAIRCGLCAFFVFVVLQNSVTRRPR